MADTINDPNIFIANPEVPNEVPADRIPELKARAAAESGSGDIRSATVDGISHDYVLRKPTPAEWRAYYDACFQPGMALQASRNLVQACLLWPARAKLTADEKRLPAVAMRLCDELELWCGYIKPRELPIDKATTAEAIGAFGLDASAVAGLLEQYQGKKLKALAFRTTPLDWSEEDQEQVVVVVRTPDKGVYEGFTRDFGTTEKAAAAHAAALSCIVLPSATETVRDVLARAPGLASKLADTIAILGGATAKTTAKKL